MTPDSIRHHLLCTNAGGLSLAIGLDRFNREVMRWSRQPRMTADIVTDALTRAWFRRKPAGGLRHHSGRGRPYARHAVQNELTAYGMVCSMSRNGNCWDHAPTESGCNSFKHARVHGRRDATRAAITAASVEYMEVFDNRMRRPSTRGDTSPRQVLEEWRLAQYEEHLVAGTPTRWKT
ncbi:MAG: DDE-type integrase/transposase/recombinase [Nitrospirota bacterium]|nr:DDE-type integrase/transposase/recombinase [Nitrospirota bacterium]